MALYLVDLFLTLEGTDGDFKDQLEDVARHKHIQAHRLIQDLGESDDEDGWDVNAAFVVETDKEGDGEVEAVLHDVLSDDVVLLWDHHDGAKPSLLTSRTPDFAALFDDLEEAAKEKASEDEAEAEDEDD